MSSSQGMNMTKSTTKKQVGRLAMRHEGRYWNAYYAMPNTMDGAILLGCISMRFVIDNQERKDAFMEFMKQAVSDILQEELGAEATWPNDPEPAPESERSGHG